jgi:hypothetical protein
MRGAITVFLLALVVAAFLGWHWSVALPAAKMQGARLMLALIALSAVGGMGVIWSAKSRDSR